MRARLSEELRQACKSGDTRRVTELLLNPQVRRNINAQDPANAGNTALHFAALHRYDDIVELLITKGANVHSKNAYGYTVLHEATTGGDIDIVRRLIQARVDVNDVNVFNVSALHMAAMYGHDNVVELLVEHGARVDAVNRHNKTSLHEAAEKGNYNVVRQLIDYGADMDAIADGDRSVLNFAVNNGYASIAKLLIDKGMQVNERVLQSARRRPILKLALEGRDNQKSNWAHAFVNEGYTEVLKLLRSNDFIKYRELRRDNPGALNRDNALFLEKMEKLNQRMAQIITQVYGLTDEDRDATADMFLRPQGTSKKALLHFAAELGNLGLVTMLCKLPPKTDRLELIFREPGGKTPQHLAVKNGWVDIAFLFLVKGIDPYMKDNEGRTAAEYAPEGSAFRQALESGISNEEAWEIAFRNGPNAPAPEPRPEVEEAREETVVGENIETGQNSL